MTPKEAAEQIIDKYFNEVLNYEVEYGYILAKACAIIHCQGIIDELPDEIIEHEGGYDFSFIPNKRKQFWKDVLNEIEKL